jgi:hypothetical protein
MEQDNCGTVHRCGREAAQPAEGIAHSHFQGAARLATGAIPMRLSLQAGLCRSKMPNLTSDKGESGDAPGCITGYI